MMQFPYRKPLIFLCGVALPLLAAALLVLGLQQAALAAPVQQEGDPVVIAAGDIAKCNREQDSLTGALLDNLPGTILSIGDNAYDTGSIQEFNDCYGPTWGRHKDRIYPVPGNHEYLTGGAEGYFTYFGDRATPLEPGCRKECGGYYSFDLGTWHIVALNSEINIDPGSPQDLWLRADLAAHPNVCTLAFWHKPRFTSGYHRSGASGPLFSAIYDYGVDIVLSGHDHDYERFAPQDPQGNYAPDRGVRQFVVGTGGDALRDWKFIQPNSEVRNADTWGVLKLTLRPTSYDWEFIPIAGQTFTDSGSAPCVTVANPPAPPAGAPVVTVANPNAAVDVTDDDEAATTTGTATGTTTVPAGGLDYVVQAGDTLSLISLRYGLDWEEVARFNGLTNTEVIEVGQVIKLPGVDSPLPAATVAAAGTVAAQGTTGATTTGAAAGQADISGSSRYTVKEGDTLLGIAINNNLTVAELLEANDMTNADLIQIGQVLILPGVAAAPATAPATTSATTTVTGTRPLTTTGTTTGTTPSLAALLPTPTPRTGATTAVTRTTATTGTTGTTGATGTTTGTLTAVATPRPTTGTATYKVAAGDTIISIALEFNLDWQELLRLNNLQPDSVLQIGQEIRLR